MKIAHRVFGFVVASLFCGAAAHAQSDVALRYEVQAGAGTEFISGSGYPSQSRVMEAVGVGMSWASPIPSLRFSAGVDGEWHSNSDIWGAPCPLPAGASARDAGYYACAHGVPSLAGGQGFLGARYSLTSRLSVGMAVGGGYLAVTRGSRTGDQDPMGSYVRSVQGTVEFDATDHMTFVGQGEQYEMPNFGGTLLRARPLSFLVRFR